MRTEWINKRLRWANERIRIYCGPNFWFQFSYRYNRFEFWEQRGPIRQMVFPVDMGGYPLPDITDWEIEHAVKFLRKRRTGKSEENFYKYKEYKKWTEPDSYVDWKKKEDLSGWTNTSPKVDGVKKVVN